MTTIRTLAYATAFGVLAAPALGECAFENDVPVSILTNAFPAWEAVTEAMAECGNVKAVLDSEFRDKQVPTFEANPALYAMGGVANASMVPMISKSLIRPLDAYVERYGQNLRPNQLIKVDGKVMAIAMMVNAQHLMYRTDVFAELGLDVPTTFAEVLEATAAIKAAGATDYAYAAAYAAGWNLAQEFVNVFLSEGGTFFDEADMATVNTEAGRAALETMAALTAYMDPEYLTMDSQAVVQNFQKGRVAMAFLWANRAGQIVDPEVSTVADHLGVAAAPMGPAGPATTLWWDGAVIAANVSDEVADASFRVMMEGMDAEMVAQNPDLAIWIVEGYEPTPIAEGTIDSANAGARPYPADERMAALHSALGNELPAFFTGEKSAEEALAAVESAYAVTARESGLID